MILHKVLIGLKKLKSIPESERIFFVQLGIFLNELLVLHKLLHFSNNYNIDDKVVKRAQDAQSLFIARMLAEKLFEGWRLLQKNFFEGKISKKYEGLLNSQGKGCLKKLKLYFSRSNPIEKVRNSLTTHYFTSSEAIRDQIAKIPEQETFELYIGREEGNCLYHLSHVLITLAILDAVDKPDMKDAMMTFFKDLFQTAEWFIDFSQEFIIQFAMQYLEGNYEEVEVPDPPNPKDIKLPFFIKNMESP